MSALIPGIIAFLKAIPAAQKLFEDVVAQFYAFNQAMDDANMSEIDRERDALLASLKQPGITDAQKRTLRKRLISLSSQ